MTSQSMTRMTNLVSPADPGEKGNSVPCDGHIDVDQLLIRQSVSTIVLDIFSIRLGQGGFQFGTGLRQIRLAGHWRWS